jgi:Tol biopolymer transport system component
VEHLRLLSTFEGSHRSPSLSPDGRLLTFVDSARGVAQVWLKSLGEGASVQITFGDVPAARPRFSPKGDEIVFERRRQGIWSVPVLGGTPRRVVERGGCPNFFPDGTRIVFDRGTEIWTANLDGSEPRRVEGVGDSFFSLYVGHCPAASPDGRVLAYFQAERGPNGDLWLISTSGGEPRRLTFDMVPAGRPAFSRDGRFVLFSSARSGARTLWRVPVDGGEPEPLTTGAGEDDEPEISSDGRSLVYTNARRSWALMVLDPATGTERQVLERRNQLTGPVFSPTGDRIAFFGWTEEREQLFVVEIDGSGLRQITHGKNPAVMPRWSADARTLFYFHEEPPGFHQVPLEGGAQQTIVPGLRWGDVTGAWLDPGGTRMAYTLVDKGSPVGTRLRDLASGRESVLADPVWVRSWSPDGTTIAASTEEGEIVLCPAAAGPCRDVVSGSSPLFSSDASEILFSRRGRAFDDPAIQSTVVWKVRVDGTELRQIATLEPHAALATPFDVSIRDEIVWVQFRPGREELWLATLAEY